MVPAFRLVLMGHGETQVAFVSPEAWVWIHAPEDPGPEEEEQGIPLDTAVLASLKPFTASPGLQQQILKKGVGSHSSNMVNEKAAYVAALVRTFDSTAEADAFAQEHGIKELGQHVGSLDPVYS